MATTTSTDNTGLLDHLVPRFKEKTGIDVKWTATGTGKALKLGEGCDVDVVLVHAPAAEDAFVWAGFGTDRRKVMANDFVFIGPAADPAGIVGRSAHEALKRIGANKAAFVSRGDDSGTNMKELSLWRAAGLAVPERAAWYLQTGQGMLASLQIAAQRSAYTLTDRATYTKYKHTMQERPPLEILVEGDAVLVNQYSVIAVAKTHCPKASYDLAVRFIDWITSPAAQQLIEEFKIAGEPLFAPNAGT